MKIRSLKICLIICIIILFINSANSQNLIHANPSDLSSPYALYINPAVIHFQNNKLVLGMKVYQLGFLNDNLVGLRNSFLGGSYNNLFRGIGIGFTTQYFTTPIYAENQFSLILSRSFFGLATIGVNLNYLNHSFNKSNFNEYVDRDDPIINNQISKNSFSIGFGLLLNPLNNLNIGIGFNHLNEPNISIVDNKVNKSIISNFGISYQYHFLEPAIGIVLNENLVIPDFSLRYFFTPEISFKVGYLGENLNFEGQFNINKHI